MTFMQFCMLFTWVKKLSREIAMKRICENPGLHNYKGSLWGSKCDLCLLQENRSHFEPHGEIVLLFNLKFSH